MDKGGIAMEKCVVRKRFRKWKLTNLATHWVWQEKV